MSASLVGSEMCIRDRGLSVSIGVASPTSRTSTTGSASTAGSACGARPWACLLYTSDAADDM
eukprot:12069157-Alexandrium_andersonii.AAC.1